MSPARLPSSFRDPAGFVFEHDGVLYRRIDPSFSEPYDHLMRSGFYEECSDARLLISHTEVDPDEFPGLEKSHRVLEPTRVPFVSYPYEWSFGQLKDAALLTLELQKRALCFGLRLKDASAYNVQFAAGRPVFIDTLSFELHQPGEPWAAYHQFCQHFLAPLALMAYCDADPCRMMRVHLEGIPLPQASAQLPLRCWARLGLLAHIVLHARAQRRHRTEDGALRRARRRGVSQAGLLGLIDSLEATIRGLHWTPRSTPWSDYYDHTSYSDSASTDKARLIEAYLRRCEPRSVWDLGANTGRYSRLASSRGIPTVAFDLDPAAVEINYQSSRDREVDLLPLVMDLTNPSPNLGWNGEERLSLKARGPCDMAFALALVHHLAIGNNVPFERVAHSFRELCRALIVEFVPRDDVQARRLLSTRRHTYPDYTRSSFEAGFSRHFEILEHRTITDSKRVLYLMRAH